MLLSVDRPGVETRTRARLLVQSDSDRLQSSLSAAFVFSEPVIPGKGIHIAVIPTGFEKGRYSALVQAAVAGSTLPSATWDLGLTMAAKGRVKHQASGRISIGGSGVPIVLETVMSFAPGSFEITAVGHETTTDQLLTTKIEDAWPDSKEDVVTLGPIALLQPIVGVFLRDEDRRLQGSVGYGERDWVRTDRPTGAGGYRLPQSFQEEHVDRQQTVKG